MPMQLMLIRALVNQYAHLGNNFKVECPVGSGRKLNLLEVSQELARRLSRLFTLNKQGRRPAHGNHGRWNDEHWRDHVLFWMSALSERGSTLVRTTHLAGSYALPPAVSASLS
jgi:hypothetical protein